LKGFSAFCSFVVFVVFVSRFDEPLKVKLNQLVHQGERGFLVDKAESNRQPILECSLLLYPRILCPEFTGKQAAFEMLDLATRSQLADR
jgi:hypothetical protein